MRSYIGWKGERNIFYKGVKASPLLEIAHDRNMSKQIIEVEVEGVEPLNRGTLSTLLYQFIFLFGLMK